ncbi:MAG TPA: DUF4876 domain-containing protein, partial [Candidatus Marinimicrobia bacterium]|nr:DUF4876 domain-containing protein [Candidatus Neomarinimicrobiota bacterium]
MVKKIFLPVAVLIISLTACIELEKQPSIIEGEREQTLFLIMDSSRISHLFPDGLIPMAEVPVNINASYYSGLLQSKRTDAAGFVTFNDIPSGHYIASVSYDFPFLNELDTTRISGQSEFVITPEEALLETLIVRISGKPGLKINEIYSAGPPNRIFYFYDQFIELYNSSADTVYLDGMIICRMGPCTIDADNVTYIYQFPGEPVSGREYPVAPGQFVVCAQDARNHVIVQGNDTLINSIDLSNADWEFVNAADYADTDNPDVPNIWNIKEGNRVDFMISLTSDIILLGDGRDNYYIDGIDMETIIDVVEYSSLSTHKKGITEKLDAGFAGVGQKKYSGQSIERIAPGFDTDNSTLDFTIRPYPTPGY